MVESPTMGCRWAEPQRKALVQAPAERRNVESSSTAIYLSWVPWGLPSRGVAWGDGCGTAWGWRRGGRRWRRNWRPSLRRSAQERVYGVAIDRK